MTPSQPEPPGDAVPTTLIRTGLRRDIATIAAGVAGVSTLALLAAGSLPCCSTARRRAGGLGPAADQAAQDAT